METQIQNNATSLVPAGFGRRFFASTLDGIFIQIANWITFFIFTKITGKNFLFFDFKTGEGWIEMLFSIAITSVYVIGFWILSDGATLGKKIFGIKIVKTTGDRVDLITAIIRYFGYLVSSIPLFLGYFWMLWDKEKRTWHDKISGTRVIVIDTSSRIVQGIIVFILLVFMFIALFSVGIFSGFKQLTGDRPAKVFLKNEMPGLAIKDYKGNMAPEAKIHFNRYQTLLNQATNISKNSSLPLEERERRIRPIADEFINELITATEIDLNNPIIWAELGAAYTWPNTVEKEESRLEAYKKAAQIEPNITIYINYVGEALLELGRYEEAIQEYERSISISEDSGYAHLNLGKAYSKVGKYDLARKHLERAIEIFLAENKNNKFDNEIIDGRKTLNNLP